MPLGSEHKPRIFVSYAHADDGVYSGATVGWVTSLIKNVETNLPEYLGRREGREVWQDRYALKENEPLTDQILQGVRSAEVLLVILSPAYISSAWCSRERDEFLREVGRRGKSKVFLVVKRPVEEARKPKEFQELTGFTFWKEVEGTPLPLGHPTPNAGNEEHGDYFRKVSRLCARLRDVLEQRPPIAESVLESSPVRVFLAPVRLDEDDPWYRVQDFLIQRRVEVLPEQCDLYPLEPESFRKAVSEDLAKCELFVQLLHASPFWGPPDDTDYAELQLKVAQSLGKPIFQWRHPRLNVSTVKEESQRLLLEGENVRAESIEDFKEEIRRRAFEKPPVPVEESLEAFVLVDASAKDALLAGEISRALAKYGEAVSTLNAPEGGEGGEGTDPKDVREELEDNFKNCHVLIVVYGQAPSSWVFGQYQQWRKIKAKRKQPARALVLFDGPPDTKITEVHLPGARVLDCRKGFDELKLKQFLDEVRLGAPQ